MACYNLKTAMKKQMIIIAAMGLLLAGCGNSRRDSKRFADSINKSVDSAHSKTNPTSGRTLSKPDADFAVAAYNGGMAEVELGQLAQQRGVSAQVKDFGAMMMRDHSAADIKLKQMADAHKITLPANISLEEQQLKKELSRQTGSDFDKAYLAAMVKDHEQDIKDFEQAQNIITYPDLIDFNKNTLPVLRKHLDAIKKIQSAQQQK